MSLFKMWEDAYIKGEIPKEWPIWEDFRSWAIANRYKAEYGYKGEFSPQGCAKVIPGYKEDPDLIIPNVTEKIVVNDKPPQKGGAKNASKKTNTRSRSRNGI